MTPSVTVRAAAKVNLHLGVGRPRPDGYHPLATVYQTLSLHDDVTVRTGPEWAVDLICEDDIDRSAFPAGEDNIVVRAGRLLVAHHGVEHAAELTVRKSIPIAGGLAGGSADAAAALVALDRLWDLQTSDEDLLDAGRLARQRRAVRPGRRDRPRRRTRVSSSRRCRTRRPAGGWWCRPCSACPRRRSTATSTSSDPTRPKR